MPGSSSVLKALPPPGALALPGVFSGPWPWLQYLPGPGPSPAEGTSGERGHQPGRGLGGGVPVATQGLLQATASRRRWASSLLSLPCPAGARLPRSPSEPAGGPLQNPISTCSPPRPSEALQALRWVSPTGLGLVTVGLARSSAEGEGEGEAGISDPFPRIQWEEVGHTWSLDSGTFSGTLLPEGSLGWALFPVLWLRQGGGRFTLRSSPIAIFPYSIFFS